MEEVNVIRPGQGTRPLVPPNELLRAVLAAVLDYRETESLGNNANTARQAVSGAALFGLTLGQVRESQSAPSCKELSCSPFADSDSR